jgi:hypothetical protein
VGMQGRDDGLPRGGRARRHEGGGLTILLVMMKGRFVDILYDAIVFFFKYNIVHS